MFPQMMEPGRDLDLSREPLRAQHRADVRPQHLYGDEPVMLEISRGEDDRHSPRADLAFDEIPAGEWMIGLAIDRQRGDGDAVCGHARETIGAEWLLVQLGGREVDVRDGRDGLRVAPRRFEHGELALHRTPLRFLMDRHLERQPLGRRQLHRAKAAVVVEQ